MIIFTLWVTGLGLLSSSSITLEKWLRCQTGWPSWLSRDNYGAKTASSVMVTNGRTVAHYFIALKPLPHLQYQRDAGGEEGHKHKVVGQDRHAAKAAHDFQLPHTWKESDSRVSKIKRRFVILQKYAGGRIGQHKRCCDATPHTFFHCHEPGWPKHTA